MLTEGELRDWQEPAETEMSNWLDLGEEVGEGGWEGTQELGGTSGDAGDSGTLGITSPIQSTKSISMSSSIYSPATSCNSHSMAGVWVGLSFKPLISTKTPSGTDGVASSTPKNPWCESLERGPSTPGIAGQC